MIFMEVEKSQNLYKTDVFSVFTAIKNSAETLRTRQRASGEIRKTTTSFVYEQSKTLRSRSAELIIDAPKASGLSPALF